MSELLITKVTPSCSCTKSEFDERIPPMGSGFIKLTIVPKRTFGPTSYKVIVETNDPASRYLTLDLRAVVEAAIESPPILDLGILKASEFPVEATKSFIVRDVQQRPIKVQAVGDVQLVSKQIEIGKIDCVVKVKVKEPGPLAGVVNVVSENGDVLRAIDVVGRIEGTSTANPSSLYFGAVKFGEVRFQDVRIDGLTSPAQVAFSAPFQNIAKAEWVEEKVLRVSLNSDGIERGLEGTLHVRGATDVENLSIPILAVLIK